MRLPVKNISLFAVPLLAALIAFGVFAFRHLALWLVVSDPLPPYLNAIFTFAGETQRIVYSKELFATYKHATWLLSYPSKRIALPLWKEGLDTSRIIIVDSCKNTSAEARFITTWAAHETEAGGRYSASRPLAVGLVSTPFHLRRVKLDVGRRFKGTKCRFYYLPVPFDRYGETRHGYQTWWKNRQLRRAVLFEFEKYLFYLFT